ncbi:alpha-amylase family glycosyl hydrolase [Shigella sonnei]
MTALYLNPVFKAPSVQDTIPRIIAMSFGSLAVMGVAAFAKHNTQQLGYEMVLDGVFNHSGDSHALFDRHNRGTGGACRNPESLWRDWYSF